MQGSIYEGKEVLVKYRLRRIQTNILKIRHDKNKLYFRQTHSLYMYTLQHNQYC